MPSQAKKSGGAPHGDICIFGDSHLGSVKLALDQGLIDTGGRSVTFWGADGPSFRSLRWRKGRIVPDAHVRKIVNRINGGSHPTLGPNEFDLYIFYGARLRAHEFIASLLHHQHQPDGHISAGAIQALLSRWTGKSRAWRLAAGFANKGAKIMFVPTSFPSKGVLDKDEEKTRYGVQSTKAERAVLWQILCDGAANAGFSLVVQPEHTITRDTLTKAKYCAANAKQDGDYVHKSPEYAALMIELALMQAEKQWAIAAE